MLSQAQLCVKNYWCVSVSCSQIILMGTPILREENALRSSNVAMFQNHPCFQEPCHNGGRCNPQLDTYECVCLSGFSGGRCQNSKYLSHPWSYLLMLKHILMLNIFIISAIGLRATCHGNVKLQWVILTVQMVLVPHPKLFGLTLRRYMAAFWLLLKCRMSGTEISDTLHNTACSWLAPVEGELLLLFCLCRQGNNANIRHLMSLVYASYYILISN